MSHATHGATRPAEPSPESSSRSTAALRCIGRLLLVALAIGSLEPLAWLLLRLKPTQESASPEIPANAGPTDAAADQASGSDIFYMHQEVLHPFLGYVQDPAVQEISTRQGRRVRRRVDDQGFLSRTAEAGTGKEPLNVVVTGGSVALQLVSSSGSALAEALVGLPQFAHRKVVVRSLAMGGYKQPQQLLALAWVTTLGYQPHIVINMDGYNDLVLGYTENLREGVHPFYPRSWYWRTNGVVDLPLLAAIGKLTFLRGERAQRSAAFRESPLSYSAVATLAWRNRDDRLVQRMVEAEQELRNLSRIRALRQRSFLTHGPPVDQLSSMAAYLDSATSVWQHSSAQMAATCAAIGCDYYHFLQPNLHDVGGKPLTTRERALAETADRDAVELIRRGYPRLSEIGSAMRDRGIQFFDLRTSLATETSNLYTDSCCHLNAKGYDVLVGEFIRAVSVVANPAPSTG